VTELRQLQRHYARFTLPERDRLVLAALERGDWEQIRALVERCPDAAALSHLWNIGVLGHLAHKLVIHLLACDALFFRCVALKPQAHAATPDPLPLLEEAAAAWFGFVAWCQSTGYDAHQLLNLALLASEEGDPARLLVDRQIEGFASWAGRLDPLQVDRWHTAFARLFWRLALDPE
jgi:hypothetical protein